MQLESSVTNTDHSELLTSCGKWVTPFGQSNNQVIPPIKSKLLILDSLSARRRRFVQNRVCQSNNP